VSELDPLICDYVHRKKAKSGKAAQQARIPPSRCTRKSSALNGKEMGEAAMVQKAIEDTKPRPHEITARRIAELRKAFAKIPDEYRCDLQRATVYAVADAYDNDRMDEGDGIAAMLPDAVRTLLFDWYWAEKRAGRYYGQANQ
jgi:hypothetical protein